MSSTSTERKYEEKKRESDYSAMDHQLRAAIDAQYGIVREKKEDKAYPTGVVIIRNATKAKEISNSAEEKERSDSPVNQNVIEQHNMLLRCLGRLRGIDYVLEKMTDSSECSAEQKSVLTELREKLSEDFEQLKTDSTPSGSESKVPTAREERNFRERMRQLEENFNTNTLCNVLHQANLDEGCSSKKDYEKLLFHYRNLSSLLDRMPSLVTVTYDRGNHVLHRITQDPITRKLPQQKQAVKREMRKTVLFPTGEEMTFHTTQKMAMQIANSYFAELAAMDDRMLGAQTRKTHLYGIKNAFFVTNELVFKVDDKEAVDPLIKQGKEIKEQSFVRSAVPVYVGEGETDARIQQGTRDNIEQVRKFIIEKQLSKNPVEEEKKEKESKERSEEVEIHCTCLITDSPRERQGFAVGHIERATRNQQDKKIDYSYIPCNWDGTHRRLDLSDMVDADDRPSIHPTPSNQAERYRRAAKVSVAIREKEKIVEHVSCMSGQDRTGTESEYASQIWARQCYQTKEIELEIVDPKKGDAVESTRAKGRNSADINAHVVGGSPGCKNDSRGKSVFSDDHLYSPETDKAMYLKSAETNKKNEVAEEKLRRIITAPSEVAEQQYHAAHKRLEQALFEPKPENPLWRAGLVVLARIEDAKNRAQPQDVGTLTRILDEATHVVKGPESNAHAYANHIARLGAIVKKLNKKSCWKKLGWALLTLAGVALVAAGLLLVVPSGGSSLLAAVLGAKALALSAGMIKGIGGGAILAGFPITYFNKKNIKAQTREGLEEESALIESMQNLQQKGIEKSYIPVPFPLDYFLEYSSLIEKKESKQAISDSQNPITFTLKDVQTWFNDPGQSKNIVGDLTRLQLESKSQEVRLEGGSKPNDFVADVQKKMAELKLSDEEANILLGVMTTSPGQWVQGGSVNRGVSLLRAVTQLSNINVGNALGTFAVSRNNSDSSLVITTTLKPASYYKFSGSDQEFLEMQNNPLQYRETYVLKKEGTDWRLTLLSDNDLRIHPDAWKHMLTQVQLQIKEQKDVFNNQQLFSYVPLLTDKGFTKAFETKLRNSPGLISLEQCQLLDKLILQCHGSHDKQPEHIRKVKYEINKIMRQLESKQEGLELNRLARKGP